MIRKQKLDHVDAYHPADRQPARPCDSARLSSLSVSIIMGACSWHFAHPPTDTPIPRLGIPKVCVPETSTFESRGLSLILLVLQIHLVSFVD